MNDTSSEPVTDAAAEDLTVQLSKPISAHGETINKIKFREPTGADIERCGLPVSFRYLMEDNLLEIKTEGKAMTQMISALANIPPSSVRLLSSQDWITCSFMLQRFFQPR